MEWLCRHCCLKAHLVGGWGNYQKTSLWHKFCSTQIKINTCLDRFWTWDLNVVLYLNFKNGKWDHSATMAGCLKWYIFTDLKKQMEPNHFIFITNCCLQCKTLLFYSKNIHTQKMYFAHGINCDRVNKVNFFSWGHSIITSLMKGDGPMG